MVVGKCGLCGKEKEVTAYRGSPVSPRCDDCNRIVYMWEDAKQDRWDLWRQANNIPEPIQDDYGFGNTISEIEVKCAEIRRGLHNQMLDNTPEELCDCGHKLSEHEIKDTGELACSFCDCTSWGLDGEASKCIRYAGFDGYNHQCRSKDMDGEIEIIKTCKGCKDLEIDKNDERQIR